eukprot:TRINITY_DN7890_c0_g1_i1.p1 TRINITY_DN7890_c0_g1~~TRINITY_DN7890_c0_g1_i1.p1  ORF type:complete len:422 (+),score=-23.75 TRINITY_DN7890_c0_g1_i1:53-1267(+)
MTGRGTDIVLGGSLEAELKALENPSPAQEAAVRSAWQKRHEAVVAAGGLHILGTERHESRRIDNQLRGRAGRQGDPGSTQFFLSLEDNLMRIFASDRVLGLMRKLGVQEGEAITHPWVSSAIENAQRKVESHHFDIRKQLLEYDNVANDQRSAIYEQRDELLAADDISEGLVSMRRSVVEKIVQHYIPPNSLEDSWDVSGLEQSIYSEFGMVAPIAQWLNTKAQLGVESICDRLEQLMTQCYAEKEAQVGALVIRRFEKAVMLHALDQHWKEHLAAMDYLRQSIHLRGYAQKDPRQEFKREAFALFASMLEQIKVDTIKVLLRAHLRTEAEVLAMDSQRPELSERALEYRHEPVQSAQGIEALAETEVSLAIANGAGRERKIGRNEPCPCGSGKKYKVCHGALS